MNRPGAAAPGCRGFWRVCTPVLLLPDRVWAWEPRMPWGRRLFHHRLFARLCMGAAGLHCKNVAACIKRASRYGQAGGCRAAKARVRKGGSKKPSRNRQSHSSRMMMNGSFVRAFIILIWEWDGNGNSANILLYHDLSYCSLIINAEMLDWKGRFMLTFTDPRPWIVICLSEILI